MARTTGPGEVPSEPPPRLGRWQLERSLGRGAGSVVYAARDEADVRVALKVIRRERRREQERGFEGESWIAAQVRHPNAARLLDAGRAGAWAWLAFELIDGPTLANQVAMSEGGRLGPREAVRTILPIVEALGHLHARGLIHRDVKPDNVVLREDGSPVLIDFGLALDRWVPDVQAWSKERCVGTPAFMAPEQLLGGPVDARVDIYALGATLYSCLCGHLPRDATSMQSLVERARLREEVRELSAVDPTLPTDLSRLVARSMHPAATQRHSDAAGLQADLAAWLLRAGEPS